MSWLPLHDAELGVLRPKFSTGMHCTVNQCDAAKDDAADQKKANAHRSTDGPLTTYVFAAMDACTAWAK
jgi:hypothetical protein